jgi:hypothetical protein
MLARDYDKIAINDIVEHLTEYINRKKLNDTLYCAFNHFKVKVIIPISLFLAQL